MKEKIQSFFRCAGTTNDGIKSNMARNNGSKGIIFQGSNDNFIRNGGLLLEDTISLFHGKANPIRCLSVDDLYTDFEDWTSWEPGTWKCVWEGRHVLVMVDSSHVDPLSNNSLCMGVREIAVATQMGAHNNVHKLLACCLESTYPVLVYEFAENGRLSDRIKENDPPLEWKDRLRIAWEISHVVAYLHSGFPRPIVHRDLKPANVYLDVDDAAKVTDFSFCIAIPKGETRVEDSVIGTYGFAAPEYVKTGWLTEKSDVYSFGVLILVLLAGHDPYSPHYRQVYDDNELQISLNTKIREFMKENMREIINGYGASAPNEHLLREQLKASIELGLRCMEEEDNRPTMEDAGTELKKIITLFE